MKQKTKTTIQHLPDSLVEIQGELAWDAFSTYEAKAFERLSAHLEVDGFRKGNVPEAIAKKHIGDELILADMAELALGALYPEIVTEHDLDVIGRPSITLTKIARGNALGFTITTAVLPSITLPDYKKLAKGIAKEETTDVTEEEVDKVIENLRQIRAYGHVHEHDDASHTHDEPLPEVNDEFAKSFGNFATVAELREKIKENLTKEKVQGAQDKRRVAIMDALINATDFPVPAIVTHSEQEKMLVQMEAEITKSGMTFDDYLAHIKKTKGELMTEFTPEAERRARFQMLINAIAKDAKLTASDEEVEKEAQALIQMYPGADLARTKAYADMMITNTKVLSMLESA